MEVFAVVLFSLIALYVGSLLFKKKDNHMTPPPPVPEITPTIILDDIAIGFGTYHLITDHTDIVDVISVVGKKVTYYHHNSGEEKSLFAKRFLKFYERRYPEPPISTR